jgi:hypothetical protein
MTCDWCSNTMSSRGRLRKRQSAEQGDVIYLHEKCQIVWEQFNRGTKKVGAL